MSTAAKLDDSHAIRRFKPYPAYRDSGVEWLGRVPSHWQVTRLKYVAPTVDKRVGPGESELPYLALEHIESGTGRLLDAPQDETVDDQGAQGSTSAFRAGDVLFGKLRPYLAKVVLARSDGQCSTELLVLRGREDTAPPFLAYQMISHGFIGWINAMTYGTKMPRANPAQVINTPVAIPPLSEQRAIVAFLDRETARIDALVAKKERLIELLEEERTALITHSVTKGLVPTGRMKESCVEWLGMVPAHWSVGGLSRWWQVIDCKHRTVPFFDEGTPLASIGEVQGLEVDLSNAKRTSIEEYRHMISGGREPGRGDVIYSRNATVGAAALVTTGERFCMGQDVSLIRSNDQDQRFLVYLLRSPAVMGQLDSWMVGSTFNRINVGKIKTLLVCVPPVEEQRAIAAFIDREAGRLSALVAKSNAAVDRLKELRSAVIAAAVTGAIDVRGAAA